MNRRKRNNNRNRKRGNRNRNNNDNKMSLTRRVPPPYTAKPRMFKVLRYQASAALVSVPITGRCLLNLVLAGFNTSTVGVRLYEGVRIARIKMWQGGSTSELDGEISITWTGDRAPDTRRVANGNDVFNAFLDESPPQDSLCGFWSSGSTAIDNLLCTLSANTAGTTLVDLTIEYVIGDGVTNNCTITDPAINGVGYGALDNAIVAGTIGGRLLTPEGLTNFVITTP
jgi:hypothetical protein